MINHHLSEKHLGNVDRTMTREAIVITSKGEATHRKHLVNKNKSVALSIRFYLRNVFVFYGRKNVFQAAARRKLV